MVLDFEMEERAGDDENWVGAHLRMPDFTDRDFSEITEISFEWRTLDLAPGDVEVYLQIGALAEDLDDDEKLDRGESTLSPSFDFDDQSAGFTLKAGRPPPGEDYRMSEDGNRNGVLDAEDPELVHTLTDGTDSDLVQVTGLPDTDWQRVSFDLDAAARRKLAATRAVRVVVGATGPPVCCRPRPLLEVHAARKHLSDGGRVQRRPQGRSRRPRCPTAAPRRKLIDEHDEVDEVFHAEGGGNQRVLRVDWSSPGAHVTPGPSPTTSPPSPPGSTRCWPSTRGWATSATPVPMQAKAISPSPSPKASRTAAASSFGRRYPSARTVRSAGPEWGSGRWRKVELDTAAGKVYVDGEAVGSLDDKPSGGAANLSFLELEFTPDTDADSGTIYIDEVHWAETRITMSGASRLSATYEYPDTVIRAGEVEVLSNIRVAQDTSVRSGGFTTPSEIAGGTGSFLTRTELAGDLLYTRLETDVQVAVQDERTSLAGGHSLRVPAADAPVVFTESYRRNYNAPLTSLNRSNGLLLSLPLETRIRVDTEATLREENLDQSWDLSAGMAPAEHLSLDLAAGLGHSAGGYATTDASYPESWILGYELVAPYTTGDTPTRRGNAAISAEREPTPVGLDVAGDAAYENRSSTENEQTNDTSLSIGVPLAFNRDSPRSWTLTPSYRRSFSRTLGAPAAANLRGRPRRLRRRVRRAAIPHHLRPHCRALSVGRGHRFRGAERGRTFHPLHPPRRAVARAGLRLPASGPRAALGRGPRRRAQLHAGGGGRHRVQRYTASYTATAVNLFGRVGAYPTFEIYRTDEFSNSLSATVDRRFPAEETAVTGEFSSLVALFGEQDNEFRLTNTAAGTVEEDLRSLSVESEASYVWQRPAERVFGLERLVDDRPPYFAHTEQARFPLR